MTMSLFRKMCMYRATLIALLLPLAACGGSSGGGAATPPPPPPPPVSGALPITADNAQDIAESVLGAITASLDLITIADVIGLPVGASPGPGSTKPVTRDVVILVTACDSGEITSSWDDADDNLQLTTGDSFSTDFDMCLDQDSGITIDGVSTITDMVVIGDPVDQVLPPWGLSATFGFVDLQATDSIDTVTINGDLVLDISSDDNIVISASIGTDLLSVDVDGAAESLSDYLSTITIDVNALTETVSADGVYTSDELEGSVTFETLEDFVVIGADNPSSGQMLISDGNSSVLITVIDNLSVQLDIDLDLDGMIDETIVLTWSELDV